MTCIRFQRVPHHSGTWTTQASTLQPPPPAPRKATATHTALDHDACIQRHAGARHACMHACMQVHAMRAFKVVVHGIRVHGRITAVHCCMLRVLCSPCPPRAKHTPQQPLMTPPPTSVGGWGDMVPRMQAAACKRHSGTWTTQASTLQPPPPAPHKATATHAALDHDACMQRHAGARHACMHACMQVRAMRAFKVVVPAWVSSGLTRPRTLQAS
jgi:hypothetical protein